MPSTRRADAPTLALEVLGMLGASGTLCQRNRKRVTTIIFRKSALPIVNEIIRKNAFENRGEAYALNRMKRVLNLSENAPFFVALNLSAR